MAKYNVWYIIAMYTVYDSMEGNPLFRTSDCILFSNAEEKSGYH